MRVVVQLELPLECINSAADCSQPEPLLVELGALYPSDARSPLAELGKVEEMLAVAAYT